ncbi:MAG: type II toxin-antitoxin system VapC family toxin [Gemmatimonadetes bacterium]|nr:type II toxin-antitoxin system VapC family toxin [Gemmatimonadota bacterium]MBK9408884.1 type II toxin-antitoxin system VapC family toxin [Gemmatimonadota bacterium]
MKTVSRARRPAAPAKQRQRAGVREPIPEYTGRPSAWRAVSSPDRDSPLLLDTHVWLWTLDGTPGSLDAAARTLIDRAATSRRLFVSDFSFWEIATLVSKGRLQLGTDVTVWLDRAARAPGIVAVPVTRDVLVHSTRLPGDPHGDPADRILLAQAQMLGASLLTCDRGIIAYAARTPGVPVCDARG